LTARCFYEILEVERTASDAELKSAFRKLAMQHHPDRNDGCADAEARFKELNEAYSILSDPNKRAAYDRFGHAGVNGQGPGAGGAGFGDVHDIFNEVFGDAFGDMVKTCATIWRSAWSRPTAAPRSRFRCPPPFIAKAARVPAPSRAPRPPSARPAAAPAGCAPPKASSPLSAPAPAAAAPAG
jgi:curved DNA-binding protein CbpA